MTPNTKPHVLIIGAGITGLLIAHGLEKVGVPFTIFESEDASTFRPREWTMGIHWGAPLLERLLPDNLVARLSEAYVDKSLDYKTPPTNGSTIYDGVTGEVLKELVSEGRLMRVSRRKLRTLCSENIDVKFGHSLEKIICNADQSVTAQFSNGSKYDGTVVIGADGPRSAVRNFLFPDPTEGATTSMSDITHVSATFSYGDAEKAKFVRTIHPVWGMSIHPELLCFISVQDVPDPEKPEDWQFFIFVAWKGERKYDISNEERIRLAKERGAELHEPFRSAILWMPETVQVPYTDMGYWVSKPWDSHNGTVTLAGDAAHPMPPYRGQGLNHAIQDALNFVEVQKKLLNDPGADRSKLMQAYGGEVAQRGAEEVVLSKKNGDMMLAYSEMKNSPYMKMGLSRSQAKN